MYDYFSPTVLEPPETGKAVCLCAYCKEDVYEGEEVVTYEGETYHEDCFLDAAPSLLFEMGAKRKIADEDDYRLDDFDEWRDRLRGI